MLAWRGALLVVAAMVIASPASTTAQATPGSPDSGRAGQGSAAVSALPDTVIEARTTAIASQLRCPVCQGLSIQDSPSDLSQQMRALVKEQVAAGRTDDQIRAYFVSKYGEWIMLAPRARGFNLLAYLAPLTLLLGGGVVIALSVRRWAAAAAHVPGAAAEPGAEPHAAAK